MSIWKLEKNILDVISVSWRAHAYRTDGAQRDMRLINAE